MTIPDLGIYLRKSPAFSTISKSVSQKAQTTNDSGRLSSFQNASLKPVLVSFNDESKFVKSDDYHTSSNTNLNIHPKAATGNSNKQKGKATLYTEIPYGMSSHLDDLWHS